MKRECEYSHTGKCDAPPLCVVRVQFDTTEFMKYTCLLHGGKLVRAYGRFLEKVGDYVPTKRLVCNMVFVRETIATSQLESIFPPMTYGRPHVNRRRGELGWWLDALGVPVDWWPRI